MEFWDREIVTRIGAKARTALHGQKKGYVQANVSFRLSVSE